VPFSVRCRYCRHLLAVAEQLGERQVLAVRTHLATYHPNIGPLPSTIGELLHHLNVSVVSPRPEDRAVERVAGREDVLGVRAVLLVDADDVRRAAVAARLIADGFEVATANDAVGALRHLRAGLDPCAFVIDAQLPRDSAGPLISWLAHHPRYAPTPIIALGADPELTRGITASDVTEMLEQATDYDGLKAVIDRYCLATV
jgi:CheY-like chemotaxis protein